MICGRCCVCCCLSCLVVAGWRLVVTCCCCYSHLAALHSSLLAKEKAKSLVQSLLLLLLPGLWPSHLVTSEESLEQVSPFLLCLPLPVPIAQAKHLPRLLFPKLIRSWLHPAQRYSCKMRLSNGHLLLHRIHCLGLTARKVKRSRRRRRGERRERTG